MKKDFAPFVYGLYDSADPGHIRYVGMANHQASRPYDHAKYARRTTKNTYQLNWIRKVQAEGREPQVMILEQLSAGASVNFVGMVETMYIDSLRRIGHRLTNVASGGTGAAGKHHPGTGANISAAKKGKPNPSLSIRNMGNTIWRGRKHTEAAKKKMSEDRKQLHAEGVVYANAAAKRRGRPSPLAGKRLSEDTKRKMSEGKKAYWDRLTPEQRAEHAANVRKALAAKRLATSRAESMSA